MKLRFRLTSALGILLAAGSLAAAQEVVMQPVINDAAQVVPAASPNGGCGCGQAHTTTNGVAVQNTSGGYSVQGCLGGREITQYDAEQLWNGYCEGDCRTGTAKPCAWHGLGCRCRQCCAPAGGSGFGYGNCACGTDGCGAGGCGLGGHAGCGLHARGLHGLRLSGAASDCGCAAPAGGNGFHFNQCCDSGCNKGCGLFQGGGQHHGWNWKANQNLWDDMCGRDYWSGCGNPANAACK